MDWWLQQFFLYCERGSDPAFWAEPFNALSNGAFLVAAAAAAVKLRHSSDAAGPAEWSMVSLAGIVGIGSFCFHTTAARWAFVFDTGSIAVLSFAYLGYALRRFAGASWGMTLLGVALMAASFFLVRFLPCPGAQLLPITAAAGHPCLNGSLGYLPVIAAMAIVGAWLWQRDHGAGSLILGAAGVFLLSLVVRSIDTEVCGMSTLFGRARGTHALWHVLNAVAIYLLLVASVKSCERGAQAPL